MGLCGLLVPFWLCHGGFLGFVPRLLFQLTGYLHIFLLQTNGKIWLNKSSNCANTWLLKVHHGVYVWLSVIDPRHCLAMDASLISQILTFRHCVTICYGSQSDTEIMNRTVWALQPKLQNLSYQQSKNHFQKLHKYLRKQGQKAKNSINRYKIHL